MKRLTSLIMVLAIVLIFGGTAIAGINDGLVAYYPFDGDATDASGNENDGIIHGELQWLPEGIHGGSAIFNGQDSYVEVADSISLGFSGSFSLATFIKLAPEQYFRVGLIKKLSPYHPAHGFSLHLGQTYEGSPDRIGCLGVMSLDSSRPSGDYGEGACSNTILNDNQWHHIVGTYDQISIKIYVDGLLEKETFFFQGFQVNHVPLFIGNFTYGYNDGHGNLPNIPNGLLDDIRIYNRALSEVEIQELYNAGTKIEVAVDIKPGSCKNPLNVKSKGVLPVAILGTENFDVTHIDPASIRLGGIAPLRSGVDDVSQPANVENCDDFGIDYYDDLALKFDTQEIVKAIGEVEDGEEVTLKLQGTLLDGTAIAGEDIVSIINKGKNKKGEK